MDNVNSRKNGAVVIVTAAEKLALAKAALQAAKDAVKEAKAEEKAANPKAGTSTCQLALEVTKIMTMSPEDAKAYAITVLTTMKDKKQAGYKDHDIKAKAKKVALEAAKTPATV